MHVLLLAFGLFFQTSDITQLESLLNENPDAAEKALLKAVDHAETEAKAAILLCRLYTNKNDYNKALPFGKKAVKLLPEDSQANYYYAVAIRQKMSENRMFAMGNTGKYKKLLEKAISADPNNLNAYEEMFGFLTNAPAIAGGSIEKAEALANDLLERDRERGLVLLWDLYEKKANPEKRFDVAVELTQIDPDKVRYQYFFGFGLQGLKRYEESSKYFEDLYLKDPNHLAALYQAARSRILGEFQPERAISLLDEYIGKADEKTQPSRAAAHWRAGMALEQLGKKDQARTRYEKALTLNPKFEQAQKALKKLK